MDYSACLVFDSATPLITGDRLQDELLIYNIGDNAYTAILEDFHAICNKQITRTSILSELSGGQKVVLMALLALNCPAPRIRFINLFHGLDTKRREAVNSLISLSSKDIVLDSAP